jgi:aminopeptidase
MRDPRVSNLAKILVRYSIDAQGGETVGVTGTTAALPLVTELYEELLRAGAFPVLRLQPDEANEILLRHGRPQHFTTLTPYARAYARCVDKSIDILSESNTRALTGTDPARQVRLARSQRPVQEMLRAKPWVLTLYPTSAFAQDAEMSVRSFEDFVYAATFADERNPVAAWRAVHRDQARLIGRLRGAQDVRIVGSGTDLRLSVRGRTFINSDGHRNMPSGEVFTGPVEDSADGVIEYDFPVCHRGLEVNGVRLVFKKGRVVEATATKNQAFLLAMLDSDPGARRLGELGIGTNRRIQRFTRSILFDEKIGGTVHLAVGKSYPETGGRNRSSIHWDMIKDLRRGGALYVDGKVFQKDGKFV